MIWRVVLLLVVHGLGREPQVKQQSLRETPKWAPEQRQNARGVASAESATATPAEQWPELPWPAAVAPVAPATAATASTAEAIPERTKPPTEVPPLVISLPLGALSWRAIALQLERGVRPATSAIATLGYRDGAGGDYDSVTYAIGAELRFWHRPSARGWFLGPRVELTNVQLRMSMSGRGLGSVWRVSEGVVGGYRFLVGAHLELTSSVGIALRHDLPHSGLAAAAKLTPLLGGTIGWRF